MLQDRLWDSMGAGGGPDKIDEFPDWWTTTVSKSCTMQGLLTTTEGIKRKVSEDQVIVFPGTPDLKVIRCDANELVLKASLRAVDFREKATTAVEDWDREVTKRLGDIKHLQGCVEERVALPEPGNEGILACELAMIDRHRQRLHQIRHRSHFTVKHRATTTLRTFRFPAGCYKYYEFLKVPMVWTPTAQDEDAKVEFIPCSTTLQICKNLRYINTNGDLDIHEYDGKTWSVRPVPGMADVNNACMLGNVVFGVNRDGSVLVNCGDSAGTTAIAPPPFARSGTTLAAFKDQLYMIGGFGDGHILENTVASYNPVTNKWTTLSPMGAGRANATACALGNELFVVGGTNEHGVTGAVVKYGADGKWSSMPGLNIPRCDHALLSDGHSLFAIGGWAKDGITKTVESCDGDHWVLVSPLQVERMFPQACFWKGHMFVVGGRNTKSSLVRNIERRENDGSWVIKVDLRLPEQ